MAGLAPLATIGLSLDRSGRSTTVQGSTLTNDPAHLTVGVTLRNTETVATYSVALRQLSQTTIIGAPLGTSDALSGAGSLSFSVAGSLGLNTFLATVESPSTNFTISNIMNVYELPAPVAGVTTASLSSIDVAALRSTGYQMQFIDGTTTIHLSDGVIGVGSSTTEALLQRLYEGLLGRMGDSAGLSGYDAQLARGLSAAALATQMMAGPEYARLRGTQTNAAFLTDLYRGFVNRTPTPDEMQAALGQLASGTSRGALAASLASSVESAAFYAPATASVFVRDETGTTINEAYRTAFGREVEAGGLATYRNYFEAGGTAAEFFNIIANSVEFRAIHLGQGDIAFVASLYQSELGRAPDANGQANYLQQLSSGAITRAGLVQVIATSVEAQLHLPSAL